MRKAEGFFAFAEHRTTWMREIVAGCTTFAAMAYIIAVNPAILAAAGLPREASITATIVTAAVGTLAMGLYARRPFAVAPLMGENAFLAVTVVGILGEPWPTALGAVFWSGVLFAVLTVVGARRYVAEAIPVSLKHAIAAALGLFLAFLGLHTSGLVAASNTGPPVQFGNIHELPVALAAGGFFAMAIAQLYRVPGALILGILAVTALSFALGITPPPQQIVAWPASIAPIAGKLDVVAALQPRLWPVVLTIFLMVFVDTLATLYGLGVRAKLLDARGHFPEIERPMLVDATATALAAVLGTSTSGAYVESAAGIASGGRTGMVAVVVALLFLGSLVFWPVVAAIPSHAYGPALVVVGLLMLEPVRHLPFDDWSELVPAFVTLTLTVFTFHIGVGMMGGFVTLAVMKVAARRSREVHPGMWVLAALSLAFFLFAPQAAPHSSQ